ncbi:glutamine--fructose-6-phosphate transaminase (isomerizing) [Candidatus Woesearchaeota archaeon]|nr:glutamine--fructose-6-phosphate transaminase (isomerizing) [Candidatus Woesearchaeota archaeon]
MCGIIGYTGDKEAYNILLEGLERLEYRGYDSAGIASIHNNTIQHHKKKGRVANLKLTVLPGKTGIAHTRWATHGKPEDKNAHPFVDETEEFAIVHNGIVENYLELKEELRNSGVFFSSDTDSEVIVHLIAKNYTGNLQEAVLKILPRLIGAYAFCVLKKDSNEIIGARNGSPLIIGLGKKENFLTSDVSAIIEHTHKVIYVNDFELVRITPFSVEVCDFNGTQKPLDIKEVNWNLEQAQKQGYKHFMLKEIYEQQQVFLDSLKVPVKIEKSFSRITIVACGTAYYAGLIGKYVIERIAKIPVNLEIASEFRYKEPLINKDDLVIAISQSGETADTLAAVRLAKQNGARTLGIINVINSTISREVDEVIYTRAGLETGVASTKAFMAQLVILYKLGFFLAGKEIDLTSLTEKITQALSLNEEIKQLAQQYYHYPNFLYIGRNLNYPLALEGALKLKEISYIHAEAYPAGELKHGPISLVSEEIPTIAICLQDSIYEKTLSNIQEIKARNGKVIALATEGDKQIKQIVDDIIYIPKVEEIFYPLIAIIPLPLFAYHVADIKDCDVDKPRNLAKSVTVE